MSKEKLVYEILKNNYLLRPNWTKNARKKMRAFLNEKEMELAKKIISNLEIKENNKKRNILNRNLFHYNLNLPLKLRLEKFKLNKKNKINQNKEAAAVAEKEKCKKYKIAAAKILKKAGFSIKASKFNKKVSSYYASKLINNKWINIRVSDHAIPMTEVRRKKAIHNSDIFTESSFLGDFEIIFDGSYELSDFKNDLQKLI